MKYIIIGFNASGKQYISNELRNLGIKVGDIFRSIEEVKSDIYSISNIVYSSDDIKEIFENNAYIFIKERKYNEIFYEGLSTYEFENNDVFIMTPDQFNSIPTFGNDVCFVWLDNNNETRRHTYLQERRKYNYTNTEYEEKENIQDFVERINSYNNIYFYNEDPDRVVAILYALVKDEELYDIFKERFK